jgi:hypothetical protein
MKKKRRIKKKKGSRRYYIFTGILLFLVSASVSYLYFKPMLAFESPFIESIESRIPEAVKTDSDTGHERLYTSAQGGSGSDRFDRGGNLATAEDIIKRYMEKRNVKLLDLYMDRKGTIYADFSDELSKNFHGDALEEYTIIADLYRRLRVNVPGFKMIKILIGGKEAETIGGHLVITKPIGEGIENVRREKSIRYF